MAETSKLKTGTFEWCITDSQMLTKALSMHLNSVCTPSEAEVEITSTSLVIRVMGEGGIPKELRELIDRYESSSLIHPFAPLVRLYSNRGASDINLFLNAPPQEESVISSLVCRESCENPRALTIINQSSNSLSVQHRNVLYCSYDEPSIPAVAGGYSKIVFFSPRTPEEGTEVIEKSSKMLSSGGSLLYFDRNASQQEEILKHLRDDLKVVSREQDEEWFLVILSRVGDPTPPVPGFGPTIRLRRLVQTDRGAIYTHFTGSGKFFYLSDEFKRFYKENRGIKFHSFGSKILQVTNSKIEWATNDRTLLKEIVCSSGIEDWVVRISVMDLFAEPRRFTIGKKCRTRRVFFVVVKEVEFATFVGFSFSKDKISVHIPWYLRKMIKDQFVESVSIAIRASNCLPPPDYGEESVNRSGSAWDIDLAKVDEEIQNSETQSAQRLKEIQKRKVLEMKKAIRTFMQRTYDPAILEGYKQEDETNGFPASYLALILMNVQPWMKSVFGEEFLSTWRIGVSETGSMELFYYNTEKRPIPFLITEKKFLGGTVHKVNKRFEKKLLDIGNQVVTTMSQAIGVEVSPSRSSSGLEAYERILKFFEDAD